MRGVHEIPHHERGILDAVPVPRLGEDNHHRGGSVEGVSRRALNLGVQAAQAGDVALVLHGHYERGLFTLGGGGVSAGLEDGIEFLVTYLFGFILSPRCGAVSRFSYAAFKQSTSLPGTFYT